MVQNCFHKCLMLFTLGLVLIGYVPQYIFDDFKPDFKKGICVISGVCGAICIYWSLKLISASAGTDSLEIAQLRAENKSLKQENVDLKDELENLKNN